MFFDERAVIEGGRGGASDRTESPGLLVPVLRLDNGAFNAGIPRIRFARILFFIQALISFCLLFFLS